MGNMIAERDLLPCAIERPAFEVGFLGRIHQRICLLQSGNKPLSVTHAESLEPA